MKRLFAATILSLLLSVAFIGGGCQVDECGDLDDICARCTDPGYRDACEVTVDANDEDACEAVNSYYASLCP